MNHHGHSLDFDALVFDMDGTIVDNMKCHTEAWMRTIHELGLDRRDPVEWERQTSGTPNREIFRDLLKLDLDADGVAWWVERKEQLYREVAGTSIIEISGFSCFLEAARSAGLRLGLATGAGEGNIAFNLDALDLRDAFDQIVGAVDVKRGKPDPEVFQTSASRLGVLPERVLVFEDAPLGVVAARAAGMRVVGVTTMMSDAEFREYDNVVKFISRYDDLVLTEL